MTEPIKQARGNLDDRNNRIFVENTDYLLRVKFHQLPKSDCKREVEKFLNN